MRKENKQQALRTFCSEAAIFSPEVLHWIDNENLWNIWVPKIYGGLELSLTAGLEQLKALAKIDGSLGWTITLGSGANYFIGNLEPQTAQEIFLNTATAVRMGGSGGVCGVAKKEGDQYIISGKWKYATGAPYLSHFTLNAEIFEKGEQVLMADGTPKVSSFVIPKKDVHIISDWDTMGLKASATHSFEVHAIPVPERFQFQYNRFYLPQPIFKISFTVFADLTLWVNYIGMAAHFLEESRTVLAKEILADFEKCVAAANQKLFHYAEIIENTISNTLSSTSDFHKELHDEASNSVKKISRAMIEIYPLLGVKASRESCNLNQIFRDYFTATQHHIFTK